MSKYQPDRDKDNDREALDPTIDGVVATDAPWDGDYYAVFQDAETGDVILEGYTVQVRE